MPGTPSAEASTGREEEKNIVNVPEKPRQQTLKKPTMSLIIRTLVRT